MSNHTPASSKEDLVLSIENLFQSPANQDSEAIGIELEIFPFGYGKDRQDRLIDIENEQQTGLVDLLKKEALKSDQLRFEPKEAGVNQFEMKGGGLVTFEPGGQIEFSSTAHRSMKGAFLEVKENLDKLYQMISPLSIWFFHGGITPWHSVEEVGLKNTKPRYRAMDKYFESIGPYGQQMMRLSTSIQVNLDFGEPAVARDRWIAANLMAPLLTGIYGNTPYFDNQPTGAKSYRSFVWQNLDKSRSGFPFSASTNPLDADPIDQYLKFALNARTVFLPDQKGDRCFQSSKVPFNEWLESGFNGIYPDKKDWENHVSLLFPEVRPRGFLEFRSFDGQSQAWWAVPALMLSSIMYDSQAVAKVIDLLSPFKTKLNSMWGDASKSGIDSFPEIAQQLFEIALNADGFYIEDELRGLMERFYKTYTFKGLNPSDLLLKQFPTMPPRPAEFSDFEDKLLELAAPPEYAAFRYSSLNGQLAAL